MQILNLFDDEITKDFVMLCTVHRSKGLEAKRIFIIDFHKMPFKFGNKETSADQYLQEINLIYVAVTRAMHELYIESAGMFQSVEQVHQHLSNLTPSTSSAIVSDVPDLDPGDRRDAFRND
jgi:superfamily I DNA/RNA helicase